jgi:thymidylate synthase (FAD)
MNDFDIKKFFGTVKVLDKGHIELCDGMVCDPRLKIVNAARVSFNKEIKELSDKDIKLIDFLFKHEHFSTFRHSYFTFRIKAPLFVFRQFWKYQIGCDWVENENVGTIQIPETNWNEACLAPDSLVYFRVMWGNKKDKEKITISNIYRRFHSNREKLNKLNIIVFDEKNNIFTTSKIKDVINRGVQDVYKITLDNKKAIVCTKNHRVLTSGGWTSVEECLAPKTMSSGNIAFNAGVAFATNGVKYAGNGSYQKYEWLKSCREHGMSVSDMATEAKCSYHTIRKWLKINDLRFDKSETQYKPGSIPWNKGLTYEGHRPSQSTIEAIKKARSGPNSNFWKGGIYTPRRMITAWNKSISKDLFAKYNYICQKCTTRGGKLQVHHIIPVWYDETKAYDINNVVPLCKECHNTIHKNKEEIQFAKNYNIILDPTKSRRKKPILKNTIKYSNVVSIEYVGKQQCYDLEIDGENKNFVCDGVVVHNSGRYVEFEPEFYIPEEIRIQSKNNKQGSEGKLGVLSGGEDPVKFFEDACNETYSKYIYMIKSGAAKEQARSLLPQNIYSECIWTASLQCVLYVLHQRLKSDAQYEIRQYAKSIANLMTPILEPLNIG